MTDPTGKPSFENPHDGFFKESMSHREVYLPFLRTYLPLEIALCVDFESVRPGKDHFVEEDYRRFYSDCVFHAKLATPEREEVQIYVLLEHQSTVDPLIAIRMWRYIHAAWHSYLKDHPQAKQVPMIVPLLLYHDRADYAAPLDIRELIQAPAHLVATVWDGPIHLIDLHRIDDVELRRQTEISAILLALKHIRDEIFPLDALWEAIASLANEEVAVLVLELVLNYLFVTRSDVSTADVRQQVNRQLGPQAEEVVVTVAEQLKQEGFAAGVKKGIKQGIEQGLERGILEARFEVARELLKTGMDDAAVMRHTKLTQSQLKTVKRDLGQARP